jgi:hypothetical protein
LTKRKKKIAVFGEDVLWPKLSPPKNTRVHFFGLDEQRLDMFDPIIIVAGTISSRVTREKQHAQVITREKEINYALKKGAHVCILCHDPTDPLLQQILSDYGIQFIKSVRQITELSTKRSEFSTFLDKHGTAFGIFSGMYDFDYIISTANKVYVSPLCPENIKTSDGQYIVGFSLKKEKGIMTFLPFYLSLDLGRDDQRVYGIITELNNALETHKKNIVFEAPVWINEIKTHKEKKLETEISKRENLLRPKKDELIRQQRLKSALWLKHNELRDVCMEIFDEMGIKTVKHDIGKEDFWILRGVNSKICICEVKGRDGYLKRQDILDFETNRKTAGKNEHFPSLLIANTYNKADTLQDKDRPADSNVIEYASIDNILIIRTLDLLKILDMYQSSIITKQGILNKIITTTGGCIRINNHEIEIAQK